MKVAMIVLIAALAGVAAWQGPAYADSLSNGGFESGDLTDWSKTVPVGGAASVVTSWGTTSTVYAKEGKYFAELKTNGPGSYTQVYQEFDVGANGTISGWAQYYNAEYGSTYDDQGFLNLYDDDLDFVATLWSWSNVTEDFGLGGWEYWSKSGLSAGTYTLVSQITNGVDSWADSWQFLDGVSATGTTATPEPATMVLMGLGLGAGAVVRRRRRSRA